ncbi:MAG: Tetratricopeptide repeat protein [Anaerolineales bacterium]|nr:Tetratricopeptide repeat protein [Anaerolineales bacterium]
MTEVPVTTNNLPSLPTSFVGRSEELADVGRHLELTRLVTLTGPGGCGKTRLALQLGSQAQGNYPGGVWWCDLAATTDPALVPQTVAHALGLSEDPNRPLHDAIADALADRRALLVLDNCEHQLAACASLTQVLLDRCDHLTILATSLQPLGHPQERVWTVPPLPLPGANPSFDAIQESDSVRLFIDRACQVDPSFGLTPVNAAVVATVCRRLDGLPLAIELAAARMRLLTVEQIDQRLDDALGLLTRSEFDGAPRHRTLRVTLDWTYRLLAGREQALLRQLSAFAGSFALDMVEAVFDGGWISGAPAAIASPPAFLDLLSSLVDKSLVQLLPRAGQPVARYRLPEVIRQYARAALEDSGEAAGTRTRHLAWIVGLAEQSEAAWVGPDRALWLDRLDLDHDDVRAALRWARTSQQASSALQLAKTAWRLWFTRGHWSEGRAWSEELLALDAELGFQAPPALRADVLYRAGTFAYRHHDFSAAVRHLEESASLCRSANPKEVPSSLNVLAMIAQLEGDAPRAVRLYQEALAISRAHSDRWIVGVILLNLGGCFREQGDYARAAECFAELASFGDTADLVGHAAGQLGALAAAMGDFDLSRERLEAALPPFERLGDHDTLAEVLEELGRLAINHRKWDLAERWMGESLRAAEAVSSSYRIARAGIGLAHIARERNEFDKARGLYGQSLERAQALGDSLGTGLAWHGLGLLELALGEPAAAAERMREALRQLRAAGRPPEAVAAMEDLACALVEQGQAQLAGRLMAAASAWRRARGTPMPPLARTRYDSAVERVRFALGAEGFRRLEAAASQASWEGALAEAARSGAAPRKARGEPRLRVYALGPTRVLVGDRALTAPDWKYLKARELFFYLLSASPAPKGRIGTDLWPEASPTELRSAFHRTMHHTRRALGDTDWIRFEGEAYRLDASRDLWYDVAEFEAHLAEARRALASGAAPAARSLAGQHLEQALDLYRGDFLADVDVGEWAVFPREELRRRGLEARLALGEIQFTDARYAEALETYRRILALDPYLETAHRELMRCLARLGETGQAARHYQGLSQMLREELNTLPAPESRLLFERLRRGDDV